MKKHKNKIKKFLKIKTNWVNCKNTKALLKCWIMSCQLAAKHFERKNIIKRCRNERSTTREWGIPPNNLLNYGYAILRATVARALVSSGMLPNVGIWHHNKYNAYCLADDIMEPYRPYVDLVVSHIVENGDDFAELTVSLKKELLSIPALDVLIDGQKSPLMVAVSRTTNSLFECFAGISRKIIYPEYGWTLLFKA